MCRHLLSCWEAPQVRKEFGDSPEALWTSTTEDPIEASVDTKSETMATRKLERRPTLVENEMVDKLYHHFMRLDKDGNGHIDRQELMAIPSVADNPLASRLMEILDVDQGGTLDFNEFVAGMSIFSRKTSRLRKLKFAFNVYDLDKDGFISNGELFITLKIMSGDHLSDSQLQQIVDKTIRDADSDHDGKISFDEFQTIILAKNSTFLDLWNFDGL